MKSRDRRREKIREEKEAEERRCRCAKGRKVAKHSVFPMVCCSGGSKSRLAEAAGAESSGQMRDEQLHSRCDAKHMSKSKCTKHTKLGPLLEVEMSKKCTPLWPEAYLQVKKLKTPHHFGS